MVAHQKWFAIQEAGEEKQTLCSPAPYPLVKHPFVVVLVGRNNGAFLEKQLSSLFDQIYENMRIVYVDDSSDDGSASLAESLILESERLPDITFLKNEEPLGLEKTLEKIGLEEGEILVSLGERACFAHEWVLEKLNQYFADPDLKSCSAAGFVYPTLEKIQEGTLLAKREEGQENAHLAEVLTVEVGR